MKVKDVMSRTVRTCFTSDTLVRAAQQMWEGDCGCVPVLNEGGRVVGMLTDRDICMAAFLRGAPLSAIQVSTAMSAEVFTCSSDGELSAAEQVMRDKKVRRLPVLDAQGRLVGLLSMSDLARRAAPKASKRSTSYGEAGRLLAAVSESRRPR
jgi:CBS domain-containing protein